MYDTHELAWAAGFIDGEGCFGVYGPYKTCCVSAVQVDRYVLDRLHKILGVGNVTGPDDNGYKGVYKYQVAGFQNTQHVYCLLFPYLSPVKREQGRKCLKIQIAFEQTRVRLRRKKPEHGTISMYSNQKCKCKKCCLANYYYRRERRDKGLEK